MLGWEGERIELLAKNGIEFDSLNLHPAYSDVERKQKIPFPWWSLVAHGAMILQSVGRHFLQRSLSSSSNLIVPI